MFAFDFSGVGDLAISGEDYSSFDPDRMHRIAVHRTRIMNAYLAFFYTRRVQIDKRGQECMVVTPEIVISFQSLDRTNEGGFGNQRVAHLAMSRYPSSYSAQLPVWTDPRIQNRGSPASAACIQAAADDLSTLIDSHGDAGVLLVDLYLRAVKAFQDSNFSLSLVTCWTITERIVNELWKKLQSDHTSRDGEVFIDAKRKERLDDGGRLQRR